MNVINKNSKLCHLHSWFVGDRNQTISHYCIHCSPVVFLYSPIKTEREGRKEEIKERKKKGIVENDEGKKE